MHRSFFLILVVLGGLLAACTGSEDPAESDDGSDVEARAGVVLTLTGPNSVFGLSSKSGMELALEEINNENAVPGVKIDAVFEDDAGSAENGADLFRSLAEDGVDVILGPTLSNTAFASDPVAQEMGVPVIAVSNTAQGITDMGDFIFRVSLGEEKMVPQTVAAVAEKFSPETAVLLYGGDDAWSRSSAEFMRGAAADNGIEILSEQEFNTDDTDFNEALGAVEEANPDIIMLAALEHPSVLVVQQAREAGLEQQIVCGNGCNSANFLKEAGEAAEGVIVGAAWNIAHENELSQEFIEKYRAKFESDPDQFAAQGYTGIYVLAEALRVAGETEREALRDALLEVENLDTVLGAFSFDERRDASQQAVVQVIEDGQYAVLD